MSYNTLHTNRWVMLLIAWCLVATRCSIATLVPGLDLPAMLDQSDSIVVGRVTQTRKLQSTPIAIQTGQVNAYEMEAKLNIERILKGPAQPPVGSFRFFQPLAPVGYGAVSTGDFGVFFLRATPTGYEILDPKHPSVVAAPGANVANVELLEQVIREVAHVLESPERSAGDRWIHLEAVQVLESLRTKSATDALRAAAQDRDVLPRAWAIAALVERGDLAALAAAKRMDRLPGGNVDQNLLTRIASSLWMVNDPRAVPILTDLLLSPNADMRRGAAAALRNTHAPAAVAPLSRALYDRDPNVQYSGMMGLAEITGTVGEWAPAYDTFLKDPKRYLDHWREWAGSRK